MSTSAEHQITRLLDRMKGGDPSAADALLPLIHEKLRSLAASLMSKQPADHTLQTTALVNEAWLRLAESAGARFEDRQHFFRVAAKAMRSVLVDHARRRSAQKREGVGHRVPLDDALAAYERMSIDLLALDEALERLATIDAELVRIVELRFFAGLTIPETAEVLAVSTPTVERAWRTARARLHQYLGDGSTGSGLDDA